MDSWFPGMQVGPYELIARIGEGAMGEVWRARDSRLGRPVAIKKLKGELDRLKQEARAVAALNHPNICQVYDVGPNYLVLEFVEGQRLPCPVALDEALRLGIEIAAAVEAAHRKGIIHRDLKPANIMLTKECSVKLLDFGLARITDPADPDATRSIEGIVLGTAAYMAPEQAEGKKLDERADIFSFGAVFYEMLAGRRAFGGESVAQVLTAVLHDDPQPLDVPPAIEQIVKRCLAKQPERRFESMTEVRIALEQFSKKPLENRPSVAVLPFTILSPDKADEYFGDGLAEEIINALAHVAGLSVTARTSSFAFRGKELDIRRIGETLGVRTVLEGSVRRAGSRIRVTAQLIDASNAYHLWSERFDREMADVFAIQDEIAQAIAQALELKLSAQTQKPSRHTASLVAYESLLKGRYFLRKSTPNSLLRGKECLEQAIALDPEFALAYAELGMSFVHLASIGSMSARAALPPARAAVQKALQIDPNLPEAHGVLATVALFLNYDWEEAGRHYQLAMARDPVPADVSHLYGFFYLLPLGRLYDAIEELKRALKEDPLNVQCRTQLAVCYWTIGNSREASQYFSQATELDENFWLALMLQSLWHAGEDRLDQARGFAERAFSLAPGNAGSIGALAGILSRLGETSKSEELVLQLGDGGAYGEPIGLEIFHVIRSEFDKAADWAEKAIQQRDPNILPATCGPYRKHFVKAGRWSELARLMNLPEEAGGAAPVN